MFAPSFLQIRFLKNSTNTDIDRLDNVGSDTDASDNVEIRRWRMPNRPFIYFTTQSKSTFNQQQNDPVRKTNENNVKVILLIK
jgi:hypothetical protein